VVSEDDKTSAKVGIHKLSAEAGMFVKAKVNGGTMIRFRSMSIAAL
jgi:hypothetical protein